MPHLFRSKEPRADQRNPVNVLSTLKTDYNETLIIDFLVGVLLNCYRTDERKSLWQVLIWALVGLAGYICLMS
jgi:hypothetical protein